ncbi:FecCD family ABC transporter permease [Treponema sp.]|uniref:FecCD family ABC transporter permease n=1 Tax=Treponema sp. TaxID=166 RepID=UPI003F016D31
MKKASLFIILAASIFFSLIFGAEQIKVTELFCNGDSFSKIIFFNIRLPRTILCLIAGITLAGNGSVFQLFFRNPLAEPGIMGVSSGATLGAVLASCIGIFNTTFFSSLQLGSFLGALISGIIVIAIAGKKSPSTLLLCGTALGTLYSAFSSILLSLNDRQLHSIYMWMLGSFSGRGWEEILFILPPFLGAVAIFCRCIFKLDILSCGEINAISLGLSVKKLQLIILISGALAVSAAVCAGGTIGFVGLIAPHITRKIFGAKAKTVVPLSMVTGASILLISDTICRTVIAPAELPVGTVTAILGAPFFISLLFSKKRGTEWTN